MKILNAKIEIYKTLESTFWITGNMVEKRHGSFFQSQTRSWQLDQSVKTLEKKLGELTSVCSDVHQVLISLEERGTMERLRELSEKAEKTNHALNVLSVIGTIFSSIAIPQFLGTLNKTFAVPLAQAALGVATFASIVGTYFLLSHSRKGKNAK